MPLLKFKLQQALTQISPTDNPVGATNAWTNAISGYASNVTPFTTTALAARSILNTQLIGIHNPSAFLQLFPAALTSYATLLATGMQPLFTAIPPPSPLIITPAISIGQNGASKEQVMSSLATAIDLWFKTGTAVNNTTGIPVFWF